MIFAFIISFILFSQKDDVVYPISLDIIPSYADPDKHELLRGEIALLYFPSVSCLQHNPNEPSPTYDGSFLRLPDYDPL